MNTTENRESILNTTGWDLKNITVLFILPMLGFSYLIMDC